MIKFTKERDVDNRFDISEVEFKVEETTLEDIVHEFELFLIAIGYSKHLNIEYTCSKEEEDE